VAWYEAPEIAALEEDPATNVPIVPPVNNRGTALPGLAANGMSEDLISVLVNLQQITLIIEAYAQGTLQNPNIVSLASRRNRAVHALLSLPTSEEIRWLPVDQSAALYESCRLAALVYVLATVFPLPPFTGVVVRLVPQICAVIDAIDPEVLRGPAVRTFIWALFLCGTGAEAVPQRPWFVKKLKAMFVSAGIDRWVELKVILSSHLWLDSAMNEPAFHLFDEIQHLQIE
jgi:hypothetical protein